jgi:hypothetical protein
MKIGFAVHFFDFRNDVRKVVELVSKQHEVVLFARKEDIQNIKSHIGENIELRTIDEYLSTPRNIALRNLFRFFGVLPRSVQNYYLMEIFKISLNPVPVQRRAKFLLNIAMKLPKVVSYDYYLNNLEYKKATFIEDIDQFICFTDISDTFFLARLIQEQKKVKVYVYSWDHPCKQMKYSRQVEYLVWNEGIKQDMIELQHIDPKQITITGASQFAYVQQFLTLPKSGLIKPFPYPYIYFGCAIGLPELVGEEVKIIKLISSLLTRHQSTLKLVVRPYPAMKNWHIYEQLKSIPNIVVDDQFRSQDLSVKEYFVLEKFTKIHYAEAFIHLGTTLGFEACFLDTPSVILDFDFFGEEKSLLSIRNFVHQYQNEKYLLLDDYPNVIRTETQLSKLITSIQAEKSLYLAYNEAVRHTTPLITFEQFAAGLTQSPQLSEK